MSLRKSTWEQSKERQKRIQRKKPHYKTKGEMIKEEIKRRLEDGMKVNEIYKELVIEKKLVSEPTFYKYVNILLEKEVVVERDS